MMHRILVTGFDTLQGLLHLKAEGHPSAHVPCANCRPLQVHRALMKDIPEGFEKVLRRRAGEMDLKLVLDLAMAAGEQYRSQAQGLQHMQGILAPCAIYHHLDHPQPCIFCLEVRKVEVQRVYARLLAVDKAAKLFVTCI